MTSGLVGQAFGGHWPCVVPPTPFPSPEPCPQGAVYLQIREEIDHYGIRIYQFPECDSDEDEEFKLQDQALKVGLAPAAPSLEAQSPMARRTPGVPAGLFGAMQALQHGGAGTYLTTQTYHQDPKDDTCSLVGWGLGGETHAMTSAVSLGLSTAGPLEYPGKWVLDTAKEGMWRDAGPGRWESWQGPADPPALAGEHPLRRHRQQHGGGGQGPARPRAPLPLGHRGR